MTRDYPIYITIGQPDPEQHTEHLTKYGQLDDNSNAKCVIFPKSKTTWEGFVPPCKFSSSYEFNNGDIIYVKDKYNQEWCSIFNYYENDKLYTYVDLCLNDNKFYHGILRLQCYCKDMIEHRLATEKEKERLFNAIKDNNYRWDKETKTFKEVIKPEFRVGNRIRLKSKHNCIYTVFCLIWDDNEKLAYKLLPDNDKRFILVSLDKQDEYELISNKFDINTLVPFESKVLIRDNTQEKWFPAIWGFYDEDYTEYPYKLVGCISRFCIPYEGNEHLLGTLNVCDDFYKTWK